MWVWKSYFMSCVLYHSNFMSDYNQCRTINSIAWLLSKCLFLHLQIKSIYLSANDSLHFPLTKTAINKLIYQNMVHGPHRKITTNILIHHDCCGNRNMHFILLLLFSNSFPFYSSVGIVLYTARLHLYILRRPRHLFNLWQYLQDSI